MMIFLLLLFLEIQNNIDISWIKEIIKNKEEERRGRIRIRRRRNKKNKKNKKKKKKKSKFKKMRDKRTYVS
jgi:hypothetical protein